MNIASRIADLASAGEVLTSEDALGQIDDREVRFERVGPVELKGVAAPLTIYRVLRRQA